MALYTKESIEMLRERIDLIEVISPYVKMQRSGSAYKGLCPFHEEKTPSFLLHKGDTHYHCFGCGAHGDAISFLMSHAKLSFIDALEFLSEKFGIRLDKAEQESTGPSKTRLKEIMEKACIWYRFFLLHTEEGQEALVYLYQRGIDLAFIRKFGIGYAPSHGEMLLRVLLEEGFSLQELQLVGLARKGQGGRNKDFFAERITFPIRDKMGNVIGFSARKFRENTFGGKYINTPETPLFKKSLVLFGLSYSRQRIAKERKALVVEGQIDALRLIDQGFDFTVAGQGTAFGDGHVKELVQLGVNHVYLALDADLAGQAAAVKIGGLFQEKGVEVTVVSLPEGSDPDAFLQEHGKEAFQALLEKGIDYLSFYYHHLCKGQDLSSPSKKSEIVDTIAENIREWNHPVMVHESLKRLSILADLPKDTLGISFTPIRSVKKEALVRSIVDPDRVLETDLLRWMILSKENRPRVLELVEKNIGEADFKIPACAKIFQVYLCLPKDKQEDLIYFAAHLEKQEEQILLNDLLKNHINVTRAEEGTIETVRNFLVRGWMDRKEQIYTQMQNAPHGEEDLALAKQYADLCKNPPQVTL